MAPNEKIDSNESQEERDKFLEDKTKTSGDDDNDPEAQVKVQTGSSTNKCPCQCTKRRCLISLAIIVIVIGGILLAGYLRYVFKYQGTASEATSDDILAEVQDLPENEKLDLSAVYTLKKYDQNYQSYLKAMGIPSLIVNLIISFNDVIEVIAPKDPEGPWTWIQDTASGKQVLRFVLGQEFNETYGSRVKGVKHKVCNLEAKNVLKCIMEEKERGWSGTEIFTFGQAVMVQEISFAVGDAEPIKTIRSFDKKTRAEYKEELAESAKEDPFGSSKAEDNHEDEFDKDFDF